MRSEPDLLFKMSELEQEMALEPEPLLFSWLRLQSERAALAPHHISRLLVTLLPVSPYSYLPVSRLPACLPSPCLSPVSLPLFLRIETLCETVPLGLQLRIETVCKTLPLGLQLRIETVCKTVPLVLQLRIETVCKTVLLVLQLRIETVCKTVPLVLQLRIETVATELLIPLD